MRRIAVLGAGAFGTALAIALAAAGRDVRLWARNANQSQAMAATHENALRLPGAKFPADMSVTADLAEASQADCLLLAVPMQALGRFTETHKTLFVGKSLVACCKGIDLGSGLGPFGLIARTVPDAQAAVLSGPSFAADIAAGLPTALTVAAAVEADAEALQSLLSTPVLRLYRSTDTTGVETGGALKNVIAIACGVTIGAGLGESARAGLMTRGYAEMLRFAVARGARAETLAGLSGLGDLALTCTSEKSRNFRFGLALGREGRHDARETTEGIATAQAVADAAAAANIEMPVAEMVAAVLRGEIDVSNAANALLSRPLRPE